MGIEKCIRSTTPARGRVWEGAALFLVHPTMDLLQSLSYASGRLRVAPGGGVG